MRGKKARGKRVVVTGNHKEHDLLPEHIFYCKRVWKMKMQVVK